MIMKFDTSSWNTKAVWFWGILAGIVGGYEGFALLDGSSATPPLTHVVVDYAPPWITLPFIAWLAYHFGKRYFKK